MNDLCRAIDVSKQAVASTPQDHPDLVARLRLLGGLLEKRYEQNQANIDLEAASLCLQMPGRCEPPRPFIASLPPLEASSCSPCNASLTSPYNLGKRLSSFFLPSIPSCLATPTSSSSSPHFLASPPTCVPYCWKPIDYSKHWNISKGGVLSSSASFGCSERSVLADGTQSRNCCSVPKALVRY